MEKSITPYTMEYAAVNETSVYKAALKTWEYAWPNMKRKQMQNCVPRGMKIIQRKYMCREKGVKRNLLK